MSTKSEEVVDSKYNTVASTLMQEMSGTFPYKKHHRFQDKIKELGPRFFLHLQEGPGYTTDSTVAVQGTLSTAN